MPHLRDWLFELKRRGVWRAAAVYAGAAFVGVEAVDLFAPNLGLPGWTVRAAAVAAVAGFPVAVVLAWAFDLTPEGVRRTEAPSRSAGSRRLALTGLGAFTVALAAIGWWAYAGVAIGPDIRRVAVLPLANLMDDPEQDYFVQGMHDRLISELQEAGVSVIARTSVMSYATGGAPVRQVARELAVDAVIEGSVYRAGERVTIDTRLVDATSEEYLWRGSFEGDLRDIAALHGDVVRAIAREIRGAVAGGGALPALAEPSVDPQAYEAYLRGVFHLQRFTEGDLDTALDYFQQVLAIDSTHAPAWVGVAKVWAWRGGSDDEHLARSDEALERALELDPDLAEAHFMVAGRTAWRDWDWKGAERAFERAVLLNPGNAEGRLFYGHVLTILGRWEEAAEQADRGLEIDPLNPLIQGLHAARLLATRQRAEAIRRLREMLRRNPGTGFGQDLLATAFRDAGLHDEALRAWAERYERRGASHVVAALERGNEEGGHGAAYRLAAETLATSTRADGESPVIIAGHYLHGGDVEAALDWLETALAERESNMPYIGVIPTFESLHDHPRFREIVRRVGVPILTGPPADPARPPAG